MAKNSGLDELLHRYEQIVRRPHSDLTGDEATSAEFYRAEMAFRGSGLAAGLPARVAQWTVDVRALETLQTQSGYFPRAPGDGSAGGQRHLVAWVDTQRRAIRGGLRCIFQVERLELIPGFVEFSVEGLWAAGFGRYADHIDLYNAAPRYRSSVSAERSTASWAAKQRAAHKRGDLNEDQVRALSALRIWAWG